MNRTIIVLGTLLALASVGVSATGGNKAKELAATVVITNEVLSQLYGEASFPADVPATVEGSAPLPDPLEVMEVEAGARRVLRDRAAAARGRVAALEIRLQELETRRLAIKNPFLARPVLTEEEAAEWEGRDNVARLRLTEQTIEQARKELEAEQAELARLRRGG